MRPRLGRLSGLASGAVAAAFAYRRWAGGRRARIDVYFDDGSFVTLVAGSPEADRLLPFAQQALAAVQGGQAE